MSGVATASTNPSMAISASISKIPVVETLHSLQEEVANKPKTNMMSHHCGKHQKKSIKCIGRFVNTYFAQVTNGTCANQQPQIIGNIQTVKQTLRPKNPKAEPEARTECKDSVCPSNTRCQDEFNRMRERLFRLLSKVPIQVETVASEPSPLSHEQANEGGVTWQPLMIKYYHERSLADILELHFNCSLIKHRQEQHTFAQAHQHHYENSQSIYGPNPQERVDGIYVEQNNGQQLNNPCNNSNSDQHVHHHNQSHNQSYQVEWQQQDFNWQPRAAFDSSPPSTNQKLADSRAKTSSGNASLGSSNNVSQHHHHRRTQSTATLAKVERDSADKLSKAKRTPAMKRQIMSISHRAGSNSSPTKTMSSNSADAVNDAQVYHQNGCTTFQKVKYQHHEPSANLPFIACDPFAPVQPNFNAYSSPEPQTQPLPPATDQQSQYNQTYQSAPGDVILINGECASATLVYRPAEAVIDQQYCYDQQQQPSYYAPCQSSYQLQNWHLNIDREQQPQMIEPQQPNLNRTNGLIVAMNDNYSATRSHEATNTATSYLPQAQSNQTGISYMLYNHHQPLRPLTEGSLDTHMGSLPPVTDMSLPTECNHLDHDLHHHIHHQHHHGHHHLHQHPSGSAT